MQMGKENRLPEAATEPVRLKVDAIFTAGTPALFALKRATKTIPIVLFSTSDPIGTGVVASLAHPGGNITGIVRPSFRLMAQAARAA